MDEKREKLSKSEFDGIIQLLGMSESRARQHGLKQSITPKEAAAVIHKIKAERVTVRDDAAHGVSQCDNALLFIIDDRLSGDNAPPLDWETVTPDNQVMEYEL